MVCPPSGVSWPILPVAIPISLVGAREAAIPYLATRSSDFVRSFHGSHKEEIHCIASRRLLGWLFSPQTHRENLFMDCTFFEKMVGPWGPPCVSPIPL